MAVRELCHFVGVKRLSANIVCYPVDCCEGANGYTRKHFIFFCRSLMDTRIFEIKLLVSLNSIKLLFLARASRTCLICALLSGHALAVLQRHLSSDGAPPLQVCGANGRAPVPPRVLRLLRGVGEGAPEADPSPFSPPSLRSRSSLTCFKCWTSPARPHSKSFPCSTPSPSERAGSHRPCFIETSDGRWGGGLEGEPCRGTGVRKTGRFRVLHFVSWTHQCT